MLGNVWQMTDGAFPPVPRTVPLCFAGLRYLPACPPACVMDGWTNERHAQSFRILTRARYACAAGATTTRRARTGIQEADLLTHNKYFLMNARYERAGTGRFPMRGRRAGRVEHSRW